jgi:effector-binding domain-containing protein
MVKTWNQKLESAKILKQKSINKLTQEVIESDRNYQYEWDIQLINDSVSQVYVYVSEPRNSGINRLSIPFMDTEIELTSAKNLKAFYDLVNDHIDQFKVKVEGISQYNETFCVYVPLESTQSGKAFGMMANYSSLSDFVVKNKLETNGVPFVEITEWDGQSDQIKYNLGYPIKEPTSQLPYSKLFQFKRLKSKKSIKAIYNGNYIASDRAWYALQQYAMKHQLKTTGKPVEFFYDNPNFGGDELQWRAEIFMPLE